MKPQDFSKYIYFVYIGNNKTYGFRNYTDPITGQESGYCVGYDKHQQPIFKEWVFDNESRRQIRVHLDEHDKSNPSKLAVDFLRNSPECAGSPGGRYVQDEKGEPKQVLVYFKEVNEAKDAKMALDTSRVKFDAQRKALDVKGEELKELCSLIGIFAKDEEIMTMKLLDYASNKPKQFLDLCNDPARKMRSLIRRGINATVLTQEGRMIKWEGTMVGGDEDDAVSNLIKDEKLKKAIELQLSKFGA